MGPQIIF